MDTASNEARRMTYGVHSPTDRLETWSVGAVDYASEGEVYAIVFWGYHAEDRAREYAAWKNAGNGWMPAVTPARQSCPHIPESRCCSSTPSATGLAAPVAH